MPRLDKVSKGWGVASTKVTGAMARGDTSERLGIKKAKRAKRLPKNGKVPVGVVRELKKVAPELLLQLQE